MKKYSRKITTNQLSVRWARFWLRFSGLSPLGRFCAKMAALFYPPHKDHIKLAKINACGFISHRAIISHDELHIGKRVLIDDECVLFQRLEGKGIYLHDNVVVLRSVIMETGYGASITVQSGASIHPKCQLNANISNIRIEEGVMIAPACALYSYDHTITAGKPVRKQPLKSKGDIVIRKEAWLGYGVIVTSGVEIGEGAIIGAGSVVINNIPANAIAVGNPAKVIASRQYDK